MSDFDFKRVLWAEGSLLTQQHFQQWDRSLTERQRFLWYLLGKHQWGVCEIDVDEASLQAKRFRLLSCLCVFPGGEIAQYDSGRQAELSCDLSKCSPGNVPIYLRLPQNQRVSGLSGSYVDKEDSAWRASYQAVSDEYDRAREQELAFALPQFKLSTSLEPASTDLFIQIARVTSENSRYGLDKAFISAVPHVQCSAALLRVVQRMIELLSEKLCEARQSKKNQKTLLSAHLVSKHLLIGLFEKQVCTLKLFQKKEHRSSIALYDSLIIFFSEFSGLMQCDNSKMIDYRHDDLTSTFERLEQRLVKFLGELSYENSWRLMLNREDECLFSSAEINPEFFRRGQCYLALKSNMDDEVLPYHFIKRVKVCSQKNIKNIMYSALSGILLQHVKQIPHRFLIDGDVQYFRLKKSGHFWQEVLEEKSLAIFVPKEYAVVSIELFVMASVG